MQFRRAMHNYFETMGIPLRRGRNFDPNDGPTAPPVAVINETMARKLFPNQDPIGQHVRTGPGATGPWTTIIGVIGDIRHGGLEEEPQPELYITYLQGPPVAPFIVLRTTRRSGAAGRDGARRSAAHRQEPAALRHAHDVDAAIGVGVDAALHPADRRRLRRAGARPGGDRRLRRDVADRQRAHARSRRAPRARRGAVAAADG